MASSEVFNILEKAFDKIESNIWTFCSNTVGYFDELALTLYLVYNGYILIKGDGNTARSNLFRVFVAIPIVALFITSYTNYENYIKEPVKELNSYLVKGAISSYGQKIEGDDEERAKIFDAIENAIFSQGINSIKADFNIFEIDKYFKAIFIIAMLFIFFAIALIRFAEGYLGLSLMLLISPITLFFICFNQTKGITIAWFRGLATYFLYAPLTAVIVKIGITNITESTNSINTWQPSTLVSTIAICIISTYFLIKIPEYANILTSGSSTGVGASGLISAGSSAFNMSRTSVNLSKQSIQSIGNKIGSVASRIRSKK